MPDYKAHSIADYANTIHCAVQEIENTGAESPLLPFEDLYCLIEEIRDFGSRQNLWFRKTGDVGFQGNSR